MTEWRPDIEFQQLKGKSAGRQSRRTVIWSRVMTSLLIAGAALWAILRGALADSPWVFLLIIAFAVSVSVSRSFNWMYDIRRHKEKRAGYTTLRDQSIDLIEVDWVSSRVIRLPGEPRLDRDEHERRIRLVRGKPENTT